jgi:hypothetical protein
VTGLGLARFVVVGMPLVVCSIAEYGFDACAPNVRRYRLNCVGATLKGFAISFSYALVTASHDDPV